MKKKQAIFTDIILIDIIHFSKLTLDEQLDVITFLTQSFKKVIDKILFNSSMKLPDLIEGFISTGDGFYCILNPKLRGYGTLLALSFNHFSDFISTKHTYFSGVRIAVHTGYIHPFYDILNNKNFIGDGLNDCSRYLEFKNYTISTVMVSSDGYNHLKNFVSRYKNYEKLLIDMDFQRSALYSFKDKHNNKKTGYLVWCRKAAIITPPKLQSSFH
jgi:uncharacterized protein YbcC (UPF0753/DUF2309 family)